MTGVKDDLPDHLLALLGRVMDDFRVDLHAASTGAAGARRPAPVRGLRSSQLRLLSLTPVDGMRVTDLAARVGMTKQALGEFANDLEERGLLETVRDPADRRVRILRPTLRGRQAVEAGEQMIGEVEARWRERLGPRKWDQLRALLVEAHEAWPGAAGA
ncbi:MarR family winged helix-turn-helix transcriptional regulator [Nocardioides euryhalodurans]|uniref:MarR family transcriptional regulator n=1 Tax=Nocardioides euryhalodurans TaxID=2518370 RepID=A0A4P7GM47_9ACTN|nr:MarR family winged helix-turn-helix transcriptional regulator [Nocardioides euryhalodurans]QBR92821.1 MarR family transcriptional regulator [Nocardioides euryhalodurans]